MDRVKYTTTIDPKVLSWLKQFAVALGKCGANDVIETLVKREWIIMRDPQLLDQILAAVKKFCEKFPTKEDT